MSEVFFTEKQVDELAEVLFQAERAVGNKSLYAATMAEDACADVYRRMARAALDARWRREPLEVVR